MRHSRARTLLVSSLRFAGFTRQVKGFHLVSCSKSVVVPHEDSILCFALSWCLLFLLFGQILAPRFATTGYKVPTPGAAQNHFGNVTRLLHDLLPFQKDERCDTSNIPAHSRSYQTHTATLVQQKQSFASSFVKRVTTKFKEECRKYDNQRQTQIPVPKYFDHECDCCAALRGRLKLEADDADGLDGVSALAVLRGPLREALPLRRVVRPLPPGARAPADGRDGDAVVYTGHAALYSDSSR